MPIRSNTRRSVIVGMSGGVDSSVSALLLQRQGHEVAGLYMRNWEGEDDTEHCPVADDFRDVEAVCTELGIPVLARNFAREYWDRVFTHFLAEYQAGRTPNPDVLCNKEIKFKVFLDHALRLGADSIATGHYAHTELRDGRHRLLRARDQNKDQTYFLYALGQRELAHTLFPLHGLTKPEVRQRAAEAGLVTHAKKDSTGICFVGERRFRQFLSQYLPAQPGEIRTPEGELLGRHEGLMYYTLGQRQGLGIGGRRDCPESPWYVAAKDLEQNVLVVVQGHGHPLLFSNELQTGRLHWVTGDVPELPLRCHAKTRYRQADQACVIEKMPAGRCRVLFDRPQRAVTPGQSVVFYLGDECLGGGIIESLGRSTLACVA